MASPLKKVALVTGASSGIGAAISLALASKGYEVVGLARRVDRIRELATKTTNGKIHAKACDVSDKEQVISVFQWVNETLGGIDVLVNNAGSGTFDSISNGNYEGWKTMMNVNVLGVGLCTQEALKTMRQRGDNGFIINISSISGQSVPRTYDLAMYSASKHAVTVLSKSLSNELLREKSKIRVTNISPGTVYTEMVLKGHAEMEGTPFDPTLLEGPLPDQCLDPNDVADAILYILSTSSRVQIAELTIQPVGQVLV